MLVFKFFALTATEGCPRYEGGIVRVGKCLRECPRGISYTRFGGLITMSLCVRQWANCSSETMPDG